MHPVIDQLRSRISELTLDMAEAATQIGTSAATLARHLSGEYARSDSLAKYRVWLGGQGKNSRLVQKTLVDLDDRRRGNNEDVRISRREPREPVRPGAPYRVVDVFAGCGGLSLGFELFGGGKFFESVLAIDIDRAMVETYNHNHPCGDNRRSHICRCLDLRYLDSEAEVLAIYLDHFASIHDDSPLAQAIDNLPRMRLTDFKTSIAAIDRAYHWAVNEVRGCQSFQDSCRSVSSNAFSQTSVIGFQNDLCLPLRSQFDGILSTLPWAQRVPEGDGGVVKLPRHSDFARVLARAQAEATIEWEAALSDLERKSGGTGRGQLASSGTKVKSVARLLASPAIEGLRSAWHTWRSRRNALKSYVFDNKQTEQFLRGLYANGYAVDVLLGGPPCQGFSRIGRGKIRSLRENRLQVHDDDAAGDQRNKLLHRYVLFFSALSPSIFIFENVRHFQAEVKTPNGRFSATDALRDAIQNVSDQQLRYDISMRTVYSQEHRIPQTRERFLMAGVRIDRFESGDDEYAKSLLDLDRYEPIALKVALDGLPSPLFVGGEGGVDKVVVPEQAGKAGLDSAALFYQDWITQESPRELKSRGNFPDAHYCRPPRSDDAQFFALMGPGKRWMDYRCDGSGTLAEMRSLMQALRDAITAAGGERGKRSGVIDSLVAVDISKVEKLLAALDGSLSLRLLLECSDACPGEIEHHLLASGYLGKREGNHGDWLARLSLDQPCKTIVSHMAKDTYAYVHPYQPRTLSLREAARIQSFPDWFRLGCCGLVDGFRMVGNAVPPLLSWQLAERAAQLLSVNSATKKSGSITQACCSA